ncbi:M23 family peptidase [Oceanidesulfovibrio marinus]|uniref:M23 family peptidase n=2 Tax=Oceanidesulfovibrio marinus TaxID=370038 RepID=A0A6P1ZIT5_9BACT|nr:M23 family peptidase [Oceanidesulfovibrio marinus]
MRPRQPSRSKPIAEVVSMASSGRIRAFPLLLLIILIAIGGGVFMLFRDRTAPVTELSPLTVYVSKNMQLTAHAEDAKSGIRSMAVQVTAGDKTWDIASAQFPDKPASANLAFSLKDLPLKDGDIVIDVFAVDGSYAKFGGGNMAHLSRTHTLDTQPPRIAITSGVINITRGGAGAVSYSVDEEPAMTGVRAGDYFFPAYKQANGNWSALFAFPYTMDVQDYQPVLMATDAAGNEAAVNLSVNARPREFRDDTINLPQSFLDRKMPEFAQAFPDKKNNLDIFLAVNSIMRKNNRQALLEMGQHSRPTPLWHGAFLRMPGATMAQFADHRSYIYNGEKVDEQTHLGFDLASTQRADVPAANDGVVAYTGNMGIYGNCVVIDHGMGLMTLYAHMSEIAVSTGDEVTKGQSLGKTGSTGMAGGDHLHFGVLVSGLPVMPVEWWDAHWIQDNLSEKIPDVMGTTANGS